MTRQHISLALLFSAPAILGVATLTASQPAPDRSRFHLFLLAGQSNMAGRGEVEAEDRVPHPRLWSLDRNQQWHPAVDPLHFDKPTAAVGPGRSFGLALVQADATIHVGLIPAAVGGSPITAWVSGGVHDETGAHPYDEAIARARVAMRDGELKAILWHQGEADSNAEAAPAYRRRLHDLVDRFRHDLGAPNLPVVIGQLGRFNDRPWDAARNEVDAVHRALPSEMSNVGFVSAEGLDHKGDGIHFSAAAARELGRRYASAYLGLIASAGRTPPSP